MRRLLRPIATRFSIWNRTRKAALVTEVVERESLRTAVLIGVGGLSAGYEGVVEHQIGARCTVVAACDVVPRPGPWPFVVADGRALPLRTGGVDLVVSNAVIEHVGGRDDQQAFVAEHRRIARWAVLTTPNRWFPIESHTLRPFLHWVPGWRRRQTAFTRLLSRAELAELIPPGAAIVGGPLAPTFTAILPPGAPASGTGVKAGPRPVDGPP